MDDKPIAMLVAAAVVAPLCALCILGPVVLGSAVAGVFAWFGGFDPVAALGLAVIGAILAYAVVKRIKKKSAGKEEGNERTAVRRDA